MLTMLTLTLLFSSCNDDNDPIVDQSFDIIDAAISTDNLSILVAVIQKAELVDVLKTNGPFTVFAPTNGISSFVRLK